MSLQSSKWHARIATCALFLLLRAPLWAQSPAPIPFGCAIEAEKQMQESRNLAKKLMDPGNPQWRGKGDLHRTYRFVEADQEMPYRLYVPSTWDGKSSLPLILLLHGANNDENGYMDRNDRQMIHLAEQHGYIVVSPLGYGKTGAYGTPLRLPFVFGGKPELARL
jgi:poly(3-hydroxybutyrate) depolymerase